MSDYQAYNVYTGSQPHPSHQHPPSSQFSQGYTTTPPPPQPPSHQPTSQNQGYAVPQSQPSQPQAQAAPPNHGFLPSIEVPANNGEFNFTPEEALEALDTVLGSSSHHPSGQGSGNEDHANNVHNSQGESVNQFTTSPSNFLDKDIEQILASTPFLRDDTPPQETGAYHILSESSPNHMGVTLNGIKVTSWRFENLMSDADFENLLHIFRSVDRLIEGKNLSKREYIMRIQLLGLLINLNWHITKPPMQVKCWRLMERKLACRKNKMLNKDAQQ